MAKLLNSPKRQPAALVHKLLATARKEHAASKAIVDKGVVGKWKARRVADMGQWEQTVRLLEALI